MKSRKFLKEQQKIYEERTSTNEERESRKRAVIALGMETDSEIKEKKSEIDRKMATIKRDIHQNEKIVVDISFVFDDAVHQQIVDGILGFMSVRDRPFCFVIEDREFKKGLETFFCSFSPRIRRGEHGVDFDNRSVRTELVKQWRDLELANILNMLWTLSLDRDRTLKISQRMTSRIGLDLWQQVLTALPEERGLMAVLLEFTKCLQGGYFGVTVQNFTDSKSTKRLPRNIDFCDFKSEILKMCDFAGSAEGDIKMAVIEHGDLERRNIIDQRNFVKVFQQMMVTKYAPRTAEEKVDPKSLKQTNHPNIVRRQHTVFVRVYINKDYTLRTDLKPKKRLFGIGHVRARERRHLDQQSS